MYTARTGDINCLAIKRLTISGLFFSWIDLNFCIDDGDLVYWAAGLLHQFAIQDLYKAEICATPNIVKSLQNVLCSSEATLQRLILRLLSFLCVGSKSFRNSVLHCSSLVARLPVCLASGDTDIVHWSVVLLHDLVLSEGQCYKGTLSLYNFLIFDFLKFFFRGHMWPCYILY